MFGLTKKEFKVGDIIVVKNWVGTQSFTVTRLTKLYAVCEYKRKDGTGFTAKYQKYYDVLEGESGVHFNVTPVPRIEWNSNEYTVISKDE